MFTGFALNTSQPKKSQGFLEFAPIPAKRPKLGEEG
jgi:hypothetical protein